MVESNDLDHARFYCGTYTTKLGHVDGKATSIGMFDLEVGTGKINWVRDSSPVTNCSHMCLSRDRRFLYAVNEVTEFERNADGSLTIFSVDDRDQSIKLIQTISSHGMGPAYVRLDATGNYLLLANYVAGNVVVYPIQPDGRLGPPTANIAHSGRSVNAYRQEAPHSHAIVPSPDNRFVHVPDLGIDTVVTYEFDATSGAVTARPDLDAATRPGSGPRHLEFSPNHRFAYLSLELSSEVEAFRYAEGKLPSLGNYRTIPDDFDGENYCAEICVAANGSTVYVSNRGHNSIAVFAVHENGTLQRRQVISSQGVCPRHFALDPSGRCLVAANQDSHSIVSYHVAAETGELTFTGQRIDTPSPALICFFA